MEIRRGMVKDRIVNDLVGLSFPGEGLVMDVCIE